MDTYLVTAENVVALLPEGEPIELRQAVKSALLSRGFAAWGAVEAELYPGVGGVLLFARPARPRCLRRRRTARPGSGGR